MIAHRFWRLATVTVLVLGVASGSIHQASAAHAAGRAVIVVTTASDPIPAPKSATACSHRASRTLRCAMLLADQDGSNALIQFNIPSGNPGCIRTAIGGRHVPVCTIRPLSPLPVLLGTNLTINGYSQPDGQANHGVFGSTDTATLTIVLDGSVISETSTSPGIVVQGSGDAVRGVSLVNWSGAPALAVAPCGGSNYLQGNFIGLLPNGVAAANSAGIDLQQTSVDHACATNDLSRAVIGGPNPWDRNVISSNLQAGIEAPGDPSAQNSTGSLTAQGNYIGSGANGTEPAGNGIGLLATYGYGNLVVATHNLISGNGIGISAFDSPLQATRNLVGVTAEGESALPNGIGLELGLEAYAPAIVAQNVISGNSGDGVQLTGPYDAQGNPTTQRVTVTRNVIGTDARGAVLIPNRGDGIDVEPNGGGDVVSSNLIEGNTGSGVAVDYRGNDATVEPFIPNPLDLSQNRILDNHGLAIDIFPFGHVTCSSATTLHSGGNSGRSYEVVPCPIITGWSAARASGTACAACVVQVFLANSGPGDQQHGGASRYLGATTAGHNGAWTLKFKEHWFSPASQALTATATEPVTGCGTCGTGMVTTSEFAVDEPVHGLTVTSTGDASICPHGPGDPGFTFRCALERTDLGSGGQVISFDLQHTDVGCAKNGVCTIEPATPLPPIAAPSTLIDGFGQPGSSPNTNGLAQGNNAKIRVHLAGAKMHGSKAPGLELLATSRVLGLSITGFGGAAVHVAPSASNSTIYGDFLGVTPHGDPAPNGGSGVTINKATGVEVGGPGLDDANVIGSNHVGILVYGRHQSGNAFNRSPDSVRIENNIVGADPSGQTARPNQGNGIVIRNGTADVIGSALGGNLISGNGANGIEIVNGSDIGIGDNVVGLNGASNQVLANGSDGISLANSQHSQVGSVVGGSAKGNLISGNKQDGLEIDHDGGDVISGNVIGGGGPANARLGNGGDGVFIHGNSTNLDLSAIESNSTTFVNTIVFNRLDGVLIGSSNTDDDRVNIRDARMYANGQLDLDLAPANKVNCRTKGDGPDGYTHCPRITQIGQQRVSGIACSGCSVDVYSVHVGNRSHHGGSGVWLGATVAGHTGQWGIALKRHLKTGSSVTATATSSTGTSEFASNLAVNAGSNMQ